MKAIVRDSFIPAFAAIVFLLFIQTTVSCGGEIYKWVDEDGTVHMTDNPASIPPRYRNQLVKKTVETMPSVEIAPTNVRSTDNPLSSGSSQSLQHVELQFHAYEGSARRIIIPVTFNDSVTARLLIDTGAPGLTISPKLADRLGLINEQEGNLLVMTGGIGGNVPAMLAVVDSVSVGDARAEFLPATITKIPSNEFEGLVGMDFMANYRIRIDNDKNIIAFDELPPQVDRPGGHDETWWRSHFKSFSRLKDEWNKYLKEVTMANMTSSETDRMQAIARNQSTEADRIYRKLESFARDKAVPLAWRH
jgi:predicted aspartyl protease